MRDRQNTLGVENAPPDAVSRLLKNDHMSFGINRLVRDWRFLTRLNRLSMVRAVSAGGGAAIAAEPRVSEA